MNMRCVGVAAGSLLLSGCFPFFPFPDLGAGAGTDAGAGEVVIPEISIRPVIIVGNGLQADVTDEQVLLGKEEKGEEELIVPEADEGAGVTPPSPVLDNPSSVSGVPSRLLNTEVPSELAPIDKSGEALILGPVWGGMTVDDFNRMICFSAGEDIVAQRPVVPAWSGCEAYWDEDN